MANLIIDLLKDKGPMVEHHLHMNYFYLLFNEKCSDNPDLLSIQVYEYQVDAPALEDDYITDVRRIQIDLNSPFTPVTQDGYPMFHYRGHFKNTFYVVKIKTGKFEFSEEGSNVWYSEETILKIDNRIPTIADFAINDIFKGDFRDTITKYKESTLWYGIEYDPEFKIGDVIKTYTYKKISFKRISDTGAPIFSYTPPGSSFLTMYQRVFGDRDFEQTVKDYFNDPEELPENETIVFKLNKYKLILKGNIFAAVEENK